MDFSKRPELNIQDAAFIGLRDQLPHFKKWEWTDKSAWNFSYWEWSLLANRTEQCATLKGGKMLEADCNMTFPFICKTRVGKSFKQ